jgi:hypothetical protein
MIKLNNNVYNAAYSITNGKHMYFDHVNVGWKLFDPGKVEFLSTSSQQYIKVGDKHFKMLGNNYAICLENRTLYRIKADTTMEELESNLSDVMLYRAIDVDKLNKKYSK